MILNFQEDYPLNLYIHSYIRSKNKQQKLSMETMLGAECDYFWFVFPINCIYAGILRGLHEP